MTPFLRRFVAAFEILGALVGLSVLALGALRITGPIWTNPLIASVATSFFGALGVAGILLWRNDRLGLRLSLLAQLAQVPALTTGFLEYRAQSPASISLSLDSAWNVGLQADLGSFFTMVFGRSAPIHSVSLNVLAVGCVFALLRAGRSLTSA